MLIPINNRYVGTKLLRLRGKYQGQVYLWRTMDERHVSIARTSESAMCVYVHKWETTERDLQQNPRTIKGVR